MVVKDHNFANNGIPSNIFGLAILWFIWKRRNAWIFNRQNIKAITCLKQAVNQAWEWYSNLSCNKAQGAEPALPENWIPPAQDMVKINVDASWDNTMLCGLGGIARNNAGTWIGGFRWRGYATTAKQAELMAIREGIILAIITYAWDNVIISSDNQPMVHLVNSSATTDNILTNLVYDCRELRGQISWCQIQFERRRRNTVADALAKTAKKSLTSLHVTELLDNPIPDVFGLYQKDIWACTVLPTTTSSNVISNGIGDLSHHHLHVP